MKYPLKELIKAYYTALSGVLTVYDGQAPDNAQSNYIVIGERIMIPQADMSNFYNECLVAIEVVTKTYSTGYKTNSGYVDQVTGIINQDTVLTLPNFVMDRQVIESIQSFDNLSDKEKVFRTIIRVRSYLTEK